MITTIEGLWSVIAVLAQISTVAVLPSEPMTIAVVFSLAAGS